VEHEPVTVPVQGMGEYVSLDTAARVIGRSYWWTRRFCRTYRVPLLQLGRSYLVKLSDLRAAMK
jgi:hypothetical protein